MCDERFERGRALCSDGSEEGGLEPAAVLVCAFEVDVGLFCRGGGEHGPGGSAVEPDVHCIVAATEVLIAVLGRDPVLVGWVVGEPGVRSLLLDY